MIPPVVMVTGLVTSAGFGLMAIGMVRWLAAKRRLRYFGFYTMILGCLVVSIALFELATGRALQAVLSAILSS